MSRKILLTLACGDYEIVRALKEGDVKPDGIELTVLTDMDSNVRHWRFLRNRDFDMAEVSCLSYMLARDQGLPFWAIPVFLHRRFPARLRFYQRSERHPQPNRSHRQEDRRELLSDDSHALAAGYPRA